jgi:hypothetical protein
VTDGLIAVINMIAMVVIVPIGLSLAGPGPARLARWWVGPAAVASVALWLPRGEAAAVLVSPYVLATLGLASLAGLRVLRHGLRDLRDLGLTTALVSPTVASSALLAERAGFHLFGFDLRILALTVAHFHGAGFAAALIATLSLEAGGVGAQMAMACIPTGLLTVFVGFFATPWVGVAGTVVLTVGLWLIAWTNLQRRGTARDPLTRTLLTVTAVVPLVTMLLALDWALGRATGLAHLSLTWMAATHGLANLLGFAVCGLLAWRRLSTEDIAVEEERGAPALRGGRRDRVR